MPLRQSESDCRFSRDPGRAKDLLLPKRQRDAGGRAREAAAGLRGAVTVPPPSLVARLSPARWLPSLCLLASVSNSSFALSLLLMAAAPRIWGEASKRTILLLPGLNRVTGCR